MVKTIHFPNPKIANILLFLFFIIFPFGQIIKIGVFRPIDLLVGLCFIFTLFDKPKEPKNFIFIKNFLVVASFSYFISIFIFSSAGVGVGALYLLRLIAYSYFYLFCLKFPKKLLLNSLLMVATFSAIFGWIQYFAYPSFDSFAFWGWDNHLFRMVGTFMDPAFTALILVLGLSVALVSYIKYKNKYFGWLFIFLVLSLAFTYSRAGYLSFFVGMALTAVLYKYKKVKLIAFGLFIFLLAIPLLPRPAGEGVKLERTASIVGRIGNYSEGVALFKKSPVFGLGYNNLCLAKEKYFDFRSAQSHSCSGLDSSMMVILATTGVIGIIIFFDSTLRLIRSLSIRDFYSRIFLVAALEVAVHSLFSNSLFYPWIMAWLAVLLATSSFRLRSKV